MNKFRYLFLITILLAACADKKAQKKAVLDSVLSIHEKVMGTDGEVNDNKMKLDTLIKQQNLPATDSAWQIRGKLIAADSAMSTWMHNFDYEQKGKSDDATITYMRAQKTIIARIDSMINAADNDSKIYLATKNKK